MTTSTQDLLATITVRTTADLVRLWSTVVGDGGFGRRTLWLVFLDEAGRPAPVVVPVDDIPLVPSRADADSLGHFLDHFGGAGTQALLLSRPGPCGVQAHDREWARALAPYARPWPLHVATENAFGGCVVTQVPAAG